MTSPKASLEQSDGIQQINLAMGQIDTTTQQNAALVEESSAASSSLQEQAIMLVDSVKVFACRDDEVNASGKERGLIRPSDSANKQNTGNALASDNWISF